MNKLLLLSLLLLASIPCFAGKTLIIQTSDNKQKECVPEEKHILMHSSQTIKNMFDNIKNDKDSEVVIPLPNISNEIFNQIMLRLASLPKTENPEEQKNKLENIEQIKNYSFDNHFHFIQAVNYLSIARLDECLNIIYPPFIIQTRDKKKIECSPEQKHILMQSNLIKDMFSIYENEDDATIVSENNENNIIDLDFLSERTFNQIIKILKITIKNEQQEEKNIKSEIIEKLKSYSTTDLIDFIRAVNFLDINKKLDDEIEKTTLLKLGLEELAKRILTHNEWLELRNLEDLLVHLWQAHPAKELMTQELTLRHPECDNVIESADGKNLISCSQKQGDIKIWNMRNPYKSHITLRHVSCNNVIASADGQNLISWSCQEDDIKIWNLNNPKKEPITLKHSDCNNVIQGAHGRNIISQSRQEETIKIWDLNTPNKTPIIITHPRFDNVIESTNSQQLISWSQNKGDIKIWNLNSFNKNQNPITLAHPDCKNVIQSANAQNLISWSWQEGTIKIWNLNNPKKESIILNHSNCDKVVVSANDQNLISWSWQEGTIKIWNLNNPKKEPITLQHTACSDMIQSSNGHNLISWSWQEGTIKIWNLNNPKKEPIILNHSNCDKVVVSANDQNLISWSWQEGTIKIWNLNKPEKEPMIFNYPHCDNIIPSSNDQNLISWSKDQRSIKILWDMKPMQLNLKKIYLLLGIYYTTKKDNNKIDLSQNEDFVSFQKKYPNSLFYFKQSIQKIHKSSKLYIF